MGKKMCVIIHKPKNVTIEENILRMCWDKNSNGAGFMYSEDNKLIVKRGYMKFKRFEKNFRNVEDKELIIHFRLASCGKVAPELCHPFKINENLAVVHNGHINLDIDDEDMSD